MDEQSAVSEEDQVDAESYFCLSLKRLEGRHPPFLDSFLASKCGDLSGKIKTTMTKKEHCDLDIR